MRDLDQSKLEAVCALLEGDPSKRLRAWLALGVDPWRLDTEENHQRRAGAAAALFVRDLAGHLQQHGVDVVAAQQPSAVQVLDDQAQQFAVGFGLQAGGLSQCVEGAPTNV